MWKKRWILWLAVLAVVLLVAQGLFALLAAQGWPRLGWYMSIGGETLALAWVCYGLWQYRQERWARWAAVLLLGTVLVFLLTGMRLRVVDYDALGAPRAMALYPDFAQGFGLARSSGQFTSGYPATAIAIAGVWSMVVAFIAGLWLIRRLLTPGTPVLGVARTLIDEALRMKIALIFVVGIGLLVPILPVVLDTKERLQYRLQFFLTWALGGTMLLLSLMTIFLACATICSEISQRQIYLTMTKPVSRAQYLLGKWLGIGLLNMLLLVVAGGGTYVFAQILRQQNAREYVDRMAVDGQVMVARESTRPTPKGGQAQLTAEYIDRFKTLHQQDPERYGGGLKDIGDPVELQQAYNKLTPKQRQDIANIVINDWYTIKPGADQVFIFSGLEGAGQYSPAVQLRFKPNIRPAPDDLQFHMLVELNGRPFPVRNGMQVLLSVTANNFQVMEVPVTEIKNGQIELRIHNMNAQDTPSATFMAGEGLEMLYQVSTFEANLLRSLAMIWLRLSFLAMLGLAAGTFLSFPVAVVLSMMIFGAALASGYLVESFTGWTYIALPADIKNPDLGEYFRAVFTRLREGDIVSVFRLVIAVGGHGFVSLLPDFGSFNPVPLLSDGRMVSYDLLGRALGLVGLLWTGLIGLAAWLIFRRRELARVTV